MAGRSDGVWGSAPVEQTSGTESQSATEQSEDTVSEEDDQPRRLKPVWIVLIVLAALLILFIAASYLFTDQMSPILDRLLYTKEELELLQGR